jgi:hypothetical protein
MLNLSQAEKDSTLSTELWNLDVGSDVFGTANTNLKIRQNYIKESKSCELIGYLKDGIFNTKPLPDNVNISIILRRSTPNFSLIASSGTNTIPPKYKILYEEAIFYCKRLQINTKLLAKHHAILNSNKKYNYLLKNFDVRTTQIPSGSLIFNSDVLWSGNLPTYLIIAFVTAENFLGSLTASPYEFKQHGITKITFYVDGINSNIFRQLSFENGVSLLGFNSIKSILPFNGVFGSGISRSQYIENNMFINALQLQPTNQGQRFNLNSSHSIKFEIRFDKATPKSINCIILGQFGSLLTIDKGGNIYTDNLAI